jgi:WD40 repeat protein
LSSTPFGQSGNRIAFVGEDRLVHLWSSFERVDGNLLTTLPGATVAAFDPHQPDRLAVGTAGGAIHLLELRGDTPTFVTRRVLRGHRGALTRLRFTDTVLLSADDTGEVRAWRVSGTTLPEGVDRLLDIARVYVPAGMSQAQQNALVDAALSSK